MMKQRRDLLVLINQKSMPQHSIDAEVEMLHELLYNVENMNTFCTAHEVIDINKFQIIHHPAKIKRIIERRSDKAFCFLYNKN